MNSIISKPRARRNSQGRRHVCKVAHIGNVAVDSGQVIITDPCYLLSDRDGECSGGYQYEAVCNVTAKNRAVQVNIFGGNATAVAATSGYGDGIYPVYAEYNRNGLIKRLIIEFIPHH